MPGKDADAKQNKSKESQTDNTEHVAQAHAQAESDIQKDLDLKDQLNAGDDLDEGELAKLEADK